MNRRLIMWGMIGLAVACGWAIIAMLTGPHFNPGRSMLVAITNPVVLLGRRMRLGIAPAIFLNGLLYAVYGLLFELTRKATSPLIRTLR